MKYIGFLDFETSFGVNMPWMPGSHAVTLHGKLDGVIYTWVINHSEQPIFVDHRQSIQDFVDLCTSLVAHYAKFDLTWLRAMGIDFSRVAIICTMVTEYILGGQQKDNLSLRACCEKYGLPLKGDKVKEYWDAGVETCDIPLEILLEYGGQDVVCLEALYKAQLPLIKKQNQVNLVSLRCESLRVTQEIEWNGMKIDVGLTEKFSRDYGLSILSTGEHLQSLVRTDLLVPEDVVFNLGSGDHLSAILFGGLVRYDSTEVVIKSHQVTQLEWVEKTLKSGEIKKYQRNKQVPEDYEVTRKCKKEWTTPGFRMLPAKGTALAKDGFWQTDVSQLQGLKSTTDNQKELLFGISELAKLEKMKGTYFDGLLKHHIDGLVHPTINECRTATGRYSSKNPNAQNFPREGTSPVKECIVSRYKEIES